MNGEMLALGTVAAIAAAGLVRRGSRTVLEPEKVEIVDHVFRDGHVSTSLAPRYVFHSPPVPGDDPFEVGFPSHPLSNDPWRVSETRAIAALFPPALRKDLRVVWLATDPTSVYARKGYTIDLAQLDPRLVRYTGQSEGNLVYAGDIPASAVIGPPAKSWEEPYPSSGLVKYATRRLSFDPIGGLGNTGITRNIDYLGFVVWMKPADFLALTGPPDRDQDKLDARIRQRTPIAPPFLVVDVQDEGPPMTLRVRSHEGKHRMASAQKFDRSAVVPVHVVGVPGWDRAADFTPADLAGAVLLPDRRIAGGKPYTIWRFTLSGRTHGDPNA